MDKIKDYFKEQLDACEPLTEKEIVETFVEKDVFGTKFVPGDYKLFAVFRNNKMGQVNTECVSSKSFNFLADSSKFAYESHTVDNLPIFKILY